MKRIISVSVDEETIRKISERIRNSSDFRSKSHLVEVAVKELLEDEDGA